MTLIRGEWCDLRSGRIYPHQLDRFHPQLCDAQRVKDTRASAPSSVVERFIINMSIAVPAYVKDIAKIQIYCAWAEAVLGETSLDGSGTTSTK